MNQKRLDTLFEAWSESRLTPSEAAELSELLRSNHEALAYFRTEASFHGQLHTTLDDLNLEQASAQPSILVERNQKLRITAVLLAIGLTLVSLSWLMAAQAEHLEIKPLGIHDGNFQTLKGHLPEGFPTEAFKWGGDPSEIASAPGQATALRFLEAAGEPNIPNSPHQSCDVFQIIDLSSVRDQLLASSEAYVELQANLLDNRSVKGEPIRFIVKVYTFEGAPESIAKHWPPQEDQILASGAKFYVSSGAKPQAWQRITSRCVLPPTAGFLVVHLGAGSAGQPGQASPKLGEQFATDIRLILHTRQNKGEVASR